MEVTLPEGKRSQNGERIANGVVAYSSKSNFSNTVQATESGAVRMTTVIDSPNAPTEYEYNVDLPNGGDIALLESGQAVVYDAKGKPKTLVRKPWAKDAEGKSIETYFKLRGNTLIQVVNHDTEGVTYPVTADPTWSGSCSSYVHNAWLEYRGGYDTIRVDPSLCGRTLSFVNRAESFQEVLDESGVWWLSGDDYESVYYQWVCHADWAGDFGLANPTWDLEIGRPNVGYWPTVWNRCNP